MARAISDIRVLFSSGKRLAEDERKEINERIREHATIRHAPNKGL